MNRIYLQQFFKRQENKIILSEKVYLRLLGLINLCGYDMKKENNEYGAILYGYVDNNGNIRFCETNEKDDYKVQSKQFINSESMIEELLNKIASKKYNCFAHVHTHPYIEKESSRFFSQADIDYYKNSFGFRSYDGMQILTFGCMLSVGYDNTPTSDDISFIFYDKIKDEMILFPNIYVKIDEKEYSLNIVTELLFVHKKENKPYNIEQIKNEKLNIEDFEIYSIDRTHLLK